MCQARRRKYVTFCPDTPSKCLTDILFPLAPLVTISYATGFSYPERTALLKGHGIDKCQCGLCDEERRDPSAMHELRQALKYEMTDTQGAHMLVPANEVNVTRHFSVVLEIVEELKRTYNSTFPEHLKHELYSPYTELRVSRPCNPSSSSPSRSLVLTCLVLTCIICLQLAAARLSEMSARADSRATWLQRSMLYGKKALECVGNIGIELGPNGLNFPIIELEPVNEGIVFLVEVYRSAGRLQESKQLAKLVTVLFFSPLRHFSFPDLTKNLDLIPDAKRHRNWGRQPLFPPVRHHPARLPPHSQGLLRVCPGRVWGCLSSLSRSTADFIYFDFMTHPPSLSSSKRRGQKLSTSMIAYPIFLCPLHIFIISRSMRVLLPISTTSETTGSTGFSRIDVLLSVIRFCFKRHFIFNLIQSAVFHSVFWRWTR